MATTLYTADGRLAQNGIIQVTFTRLERQDPPLSALVYRTPNGPVGMGEATFRIEKPGTYQVAVTVISEAGEQGTVDCNRSVPPWFRYVLLLNRRGD